MNINTIGKRVVCEWLLAQAIKSTINFFRLLVLPLCGESSPLHIPATPAM
jgi:hypothetical protein